MNGNAGELLAETRGGPELTLAHLRAAAYGCVLLALTVHFVFYLRHALAAVVFPFELDYGEGIVWQQALLMPGNLMYGDITRFPFIVFHYPPVYHLLVRAVSALGFDMLAAGRAISVLCTLVIGGLVAALSHDAIGRQSGRAARLIGSAIAGLTVFCYWPVVCWSPMMRVDMLSIMFTLSGVWLSGRSFRHERLLYLAVLSFVLAVYTKQTSIAAPISVMLVSAVTGRRLMLRAFGLGLLVGLAGLLTLTCVTHGGFVRHLLLYNLNRFSPESVVSAIEDEWPQAIFLALAIGGLAANWRMSRAGPNENKLNWLMDRMTRHRSGRVMAILTLYAFLATCMLATLGKSGAKLNYMIEWMCIWSVFIGVFVASAVGRFEVGPKPAPAGGLKPMLALMVPIALLAQVIIMPTERNYFGDDAARNRELAALVDRIKAAPGPVLSDDMVLLLKAGKQVPWEPAIFAELASTGRWDERLILDLIANRTFSFIITRGHAGDEMYDSRYTPSVDRAIQEAYPRTEDQGGRTLHFPPPDPRSPQIGPA